MKMGMGAFESMFANAKAPKCEALPAIWTIRT